MDFSGAIVKAVLTTVFAAVVTWFVSQRHTWATVGVAALVLVPQLLFALFHDVGGFVQEEEKKRNRRVGMRADGWVADDDETFAPSEVRERALRLRAEAEADAGTTFRERSRRAANHQPLRSAAKDEVRSIRARIPKFGRASNDEDYEEFWGRE